MAFEISKIDTLYKTLKEHDDNGIVYNYKIEFTTPDNGMMLQQFVKMDTGAELCRKKINYLIEEMGADTIRVKVYSGENQRHLLNKEPYLIEVRDTGSQKRRVLMQEAEPAPQNYVPAAQPSQPLPGLGSLEGFTGLAGLEKVLEARTQVRDKEYELRVASDKMTAIQEKLGDLEKEFDEIEQENEKLWDENNHLKTENEKLKKYKPEGNFKLLGFDGSKLLGSIIGESVRHIARKNPTGALKIAERLGLTSDDLAGFIEDGTPEEHLTPEQPDNEQLTEAQQKHLAVCDEIRDWLYDVSTDELTDLYRVLYVLVHNTALVQPTITFLKSKTTQREEKEP
jgi:hypothetical protein